VGIKQKGFTIVELLIVIVVIGILAAIVIMAYNGIQNRANDASVQTDLKNIGKALENYRAVKGTYPVSETALESMYDPVTGASEAAIKINKNAYDVLAIAAPGDLAHRNLVICVQAGTNPKIGVAALSKSGQVWFYTSGGGLTKDSNPWVGQQTTICPRLGIASPPADPVTALYSRSFGYERAAAEPNPTVGWKTWTGQ
jgi:type II secretion system protein G